MSTKERSKELTYLLEGPKALFADPLTSGGGERCTLDIPSYDAIKGVTKNIYWKPTFSWIVDDVRVMSRIERGNEGVKFPSVTENGNCDRCNHTYLKNVKYQVRAHIEWNDGRPEYEDDRDMNKHYEMACRKLKKGGNLPVSLGISDYSAMVSPCTFGEGDGYYDNDDTQRIYMNMYHSHIYPDELSDEEREEHGLLKREKARSVLKSSLYRNSDDIVFQNGYIHYNRPEECKTHELIKDDCKVELIGKRKKDKEKKRKRKKSK